MPDGVLDPMDTNGNRLLSLLPACRSSERFGHWAVGERAAQARGRQAEG